MRGAGLPAAMLFAIVGLMLAFAPRRVILPAVGIALVVALAASFVPIGASHEWVFAGCWASVILIALSIYLPRGVPLALALGLAADAGLFAGLVVSAEGTRLDLAKAAPLLALVIPALLLRDRKLGVLIKIVTSWLIAVSLLAALLPLTPTPAMCRIIWSRWCSGKRNAARGQASNPFTPRRDLDRSRRHGHGR